MAKVIIKQNPFVHQIFNDLEELLEFCREHGHVYDERALTDMTMYTAQQFARYRSHKQVRDQWADDARKFAL